MISSMRVPRNIGQAVMLPEIQLVKGGVGVEIELVWDRRATPGAEHNSNLDNSGIYYNRDKTSDKC